jgi:hypothetical protein
MPGKRAYLLADPKKQSLNLASAGWTSLGSSAVIRLPTKPLDPVDTVVVLQL